MKLLLDTHVALWALAEPQRLPPELRQRLSDPAHEVMVSIVSVWEVAIKHSIVRPDGQRKLGVSSGVVLEWLEKTGFGVLAVSPQHCVQVDALPWEEGSTGRRFHGDPFDRMLLAQALVEPIRLVTADPQIAAYLPEAAGVIEKIEARPR